MSFLRAIMLVLALIVAAGGMIACTGGSDAPTLACQPDEGPITHGPRVGGVTDTTAKVWVRACEALDVQVQYQAGGGAWQDGASEQTNAERDGTAVIELTGLTPHTEYSYRVVLDDQPTDELSGEFRTLIGADQPGVLTFLFGADTRPEGDRVGYETMSALDADFAILAGDQIYVDPQLPPDEPFFDPKGKEDYEAVYRAAWAEPTFRRFLTTTPTMMMWDDHEILNDWAAGTESPYPWAAAAYDEYQHSANPTSFRPGVYYYTMRAGPSDFFVLDERTFRSPDSQRDDEFKTMIGREQKADLKMWLLNSTALFKFIVSPVMFSDYSKHGEEGWVAFKAERNEILDFVREHHVPGVVLLSGDEHWAAVLRLQPWSLYELGPTPIAGFSGVPTDETGPDILFKLGQTALFGSVTIDTNACPATVTLRVIDAFGRERYALPLTEGDLLQPIIAPEEYCAARNAGGLDIDSDGCTDAQERGDDETLGGRRDPLYHWDFYDVNGDRVVDNLDAIAVADSLGAKVQDSGRLAKLYDPVLDRSEPADGAEEWSAGPPDGVIDDTDVLLVTAQNGASCASPTVP
jgi:alkaline phosphatase D